MGLKNIWNGRGILPEICTVTCRNHHPLTYYGRSNLCTIRMVLAQPNSLLSWFTKSTIYSKRRWWILHITEDYVFRILLELLESQELLELLVSIGASGGTSSTPGIGSPSPSGATGGVSGTIGTITPSTSKLTSYRVSNCLWWWHWARQSALYVWPYSLSSVAEYITITDSHIVEIDWWETGTFASSNVKVALTSFQFTELIFTCPYMVSKRN